MALTDGIIAYWNFNNDGSGNVSLLDSTPHGNNLVVVTAPDPSLGTGIIGGDAVGNGSGYYLTSSPLDFSGDFSINYWVKNPTNPLIQEFCGNDIGGLNFNISNHSVYVGIANVDVIAEYTFTVDPALWYMATCTRRSNYFVIYLNGTEVAATESEVITDYSSLFGLFASVQGTFNNSYGVELDEFGVWNRQLNPDEITQLYNNGAAITYPFSQTPSGKSFFSLARMLKLPPFVNVQSSQQTQEFSISKLLNLPWFINI